jgi:homoserine O-acetyltransferase/O-succinyltransferase
MLTRLFSAIATVALFAAPIAAQRPAGPGVTGDYVIRDFRFTNGQRLDSLTMHYRTLGTPKRDARGVVRNAVLILHGTTGSGSQFLSPLFANELYRAGQPLDTTVYYIVLPDGIGHGASSRPSAGLRAHFPHYDYADMIEAQHRLLVDHLGVAHLRVVMGTSMGGMHSWMWGERYPDFADGIVPLASVPTQIAGRNRMLRRMIMQDITTDPEWRQGDYTSQPRGLRAAMQILFVMTSAPLVQQRSAPTREKADSAIDGILDARVRSMDANDVLYAFDASRNYDPSAKLGLITAPLLAINSADDQVNPPELGLMEELMPRVRHGRYLLIPISPITRGHGTHTVAAAWKTPFREFLDSLPPLPALH